MLAIEENENVNLPKQHHEVHNLCALIYDNLTEILSGESEVYQNLYKTDFDIKDTHQSVEQVRSGELHALDWLALNNMNEELSIALTKRLTTDLTFDFVSFVYESLNTAKKGKLTVAYSLLRKPFTDVLLLLEQILIDKDAFVHKFFHVGDPEQYDPSKANIDKLAIITNAVGKLRAGSMFKPEFIYQLRYDKSCEYGINGISNKAIHIVTSQKHYKTESQSFNFGFLSDEDRESLWSHYYLIIPYLLIYATAIVDAIVFDLLPEEIEARDNKAIKRFIAFMVYSELMSSDSNIDSIIDIMSDALSHQCKMCKNEIRFEYADLKLFLESDIMICDQCFTNQFADAEFEEKFMMFWLEGVGV